MAWRVCAERDCTEVFERDNGRRPHTRCPAHRPAAGWTRYPEEYRRNRATLLASHPPCWVYGCNRPATTADHIVPRIHGGSDKIENLRPACLHHNEASGAALSRGGRGAEDAVRRPVRKRQQPAPRITFMA
jgi:5-methylcytosine-specific restriction endonuclease McrA